MYIHTYVFIYIDKGRNSLFVLCARLVLAGEEEKSLTDKLSHNHTPHATSHVPPPAAGFMLSDTQVCDL